MESRAMPIPDGLIGDRADAAVARLLGFSRSYAAEVIEAGGARLDGVVLGHGRAEAPVVLPPEGDAELALQSVLRLDRALALWTQARFSGRKVLPYRLSGRATFKGYGELPFERVGEASLKDLGRWRKGMRSDDKPL